jgi:SET domain-containing protein
MINNDENIEIKHSRKHGQGVFAKRGFNKGESIYEFPKGRIIQKEEIKNVPDDELTYVGFMDGEYEMMEAPAKFVNHSCDPNLEEKDRAGIALRAIAADEELTIDYDKVAFLLEPFLCNCAAKNCRGIIVGRPI